MDAFAWRIAWKVTLGTSAASTPAAATLSFFCSDLATSERVKGRGPRKGYRAGFENGPRLHRLPWLLFGCALPGAPLPIGFLPVVRGRSLSVPRAGCHLCIKVTNGVPCNVRKYLCVMLCPTERHHERLHTRSHAPNRRGRRRRGTVS